MTSILSAIHWANVTAESVRILQYLKSYSSPQATRWSAYSFRGMTSMLSPYNILVFQTTKGTVCSASAPVLESKRGGPQALCRIGDQCELSTLTTAMKPKLDRSSTHGQGRRLHTRANIDQSRPGLGAQPFSEILSPWGPQSYREGSIPICTSPSIKTRLWLSTCVAISWEPVWGPLRPALTLLPASSRFRPFLVAVLRRQRRKPRPELRSLEALLSRHRRLLSRCFSLVWLSIIKLLQDSDK